MDKELATRWVEALRSGKYEQGTTRLRTIDNKYCCIGVLADIIGCKWKVHHRNTYFKPDIYDIEDHTGSLPRNIENKIFNSSYTQESFIDLNDNRKMSFNEIANVIERDYAKL